MSTISHRIPLHGDPNPMTKMIHWASMATLNPNGFRTSSEKKNRGARLGSPNRKLKHPRGRFLTRVEKLANAL
jgi:hypothetical protein